MVTAELERQIDGDDIEAIHVYPRVGAEHKFSSDCWCHPAVNYCRCGCGQELMVFHNVSH